jgi:hypothetical protein
MNDTPSKTLDDLAEDWAAMKVPPEDSGLEMSVWITENDGYQHDVRVKVAVRHGTGTSWYSDSVSVRIRPTVQLAAGDRSRRGEPLASVGLAAAARWIELNRQTIIDFWDGKLSPRQAQAQLIGV